MSELTAKDNFRLGFLLRCAEEGCTIEEVQDRVKIAAGGGLDVLRSLIRPAWNGVKTLATAPIHATALGIAGAGILGAGGGYGLAKLQNSDIDPEEAQRQELISAFKLQAELARRRAQQYSYRRGVPALPSFS